MASKRNNRHLDVNLNSHFLGLISGSVIGIVIAIFFVIGVFSWVFLLSSKGDKTSMYVVLGIVSLILLAGNIYGICRIGYDGFARGLWLTWVAGIVMTVIGFFIGNVHILSVNGEENFIAHGLLELLIFIPVSMVLIIVPVVIISVIAWLIINIFGQN